MMIRLAKVHGMMIGLLFYSNAIQMSYVRCIQFIVFPLNGTPKPSPNKRLPQPGAVGRAPMSRRGTGRGRAKGEHGVPHPTFWATYLAWDGTLRS